MKNIEHFGIISHLLYESFSKEISIGMSKPQKIVPQLGADIILIFEPNSSLGDNGDRITFIQTVSDTIKYSTTAGEQAYPWIENTTSQFDKRNPSKDGSLGQVIDQQFMSNKDFRYTESRDASTDKFSERSEKAKK